MSTDIHGYTDVAMAIATRLGFDLCPRLKVLKDRHLFPVSASWQGHS
jgi:TnpA family transposase